MTETIETKMVLTATLSNNEAVYKQLAAMRKLAADLRSDSVEVCHNHTSKSIQLPVATLRWSKLRGCRTLKFMVRDNFHDINLYVACGEPIEMPRDVFYEQKDFAWYMDNIERNRGYTFKDWTDEEMNDPRILRVMRKNGNGWSTVKPEEKDRWAARMTSTEWYENHWSSGALMPMGNVPFDEHTKFYRAPHAYAEGIPERADHYRGPCTKFILALNSWSDLERVCRAIVGHIEQK